MHRTFNHYTSHRSKQFYVWLLASIAINFIYMGCEASHTPPSEVSLYVSDTTGMTADMSISQSDWTMNEQMDQSLDQEIDQIPMDPHAIASSEIPPQIFRLTQAQYKRIIQTVFGASINLRFNLEPDLHVEGFASLGAGVTFPESP